MSDNMIANALIEALKRVPIMDYSVFNATVTRMAVMLGAENPEYVRKLAACEVVTSMKLGDPV